jgi:hypothetical protein
MDVSGMFAIVDLSQRDTRGQILMLLDDETAAADVASELARRAVPVVVRRLSAEDVDRVRRNVYAVA